MSKKAFDVVDAVKHINPVSVGSTVVRTVVSATAGEKRCPKCGKMAKQDMSFTNSMGHRC